MDYEVLKFWFTLANFLLTGGVGFYVHISNKNRVTNERVSTIAEKMDGRLDDHDRRLATVEELVKHLPRHDDMTGLRQMCERVGGEVKGLRGEMSGMAQLLAQMQKPVDMITQYLINHGK